eukprot:3748588-Amphidinium_carterae.2
MKWLTAANLGAAAHAAHEPTPEYLRWESVAKAVRNVWLLVGPKLKERPEAWPRVRLPALAEEEVVAPLLAVPEEHNAQAPHVEGPHKRVVTYNTFARCLDCHRQTRKVKGKFNFACLRGQECRQLKKRHRARLDPLVVQHPEEMP